MLPALLTVLLSTVVLASSAAGAVGAVGAVGVGSPAGEDSPPRSADRSAVDRFVEDQLDRHGIPGLTLALIEDGEVTYTQAFGEDGDGRRLSPRSAMPIASMTKPMTAVLILQLAEAGELELDDAVQEHLPWFEVADPEVSEQITLRHLLQHTSGISERGYDPFLDHESSLEDAVRDLQKAEPVAEPGERYEYANQNYTTLALLAETVTGRPWARLLQYNVFEPLGMADTTADWDSAEPTRGHVKLFGAAVGQDMPHRRYLDGADNVVSTAPDLARFAAAVGLGDRRLLTPSSHREMRTLPDVKGATYGLGWEQLGEHRGKQVEGHDGLELTYSGQMSVMPEPESGYVLLTNQGHLLETMIARPQLRVGMLDLLLGEDPETGGLAATWLGWVLLSAFALVLFFGVRSLIRLRGWRRRSSALSRRRVAWEIGSHLLTAALVVLLLYWLVPTLLGRAYNLGEVGRYHLPDVTLVLSTSVVLDVVAAVAMLVLLRCRGVPTSGSGSGS